MVHSEPNKALGALHRDAADDWDNYLVRGLNGEKELLVHSRNETKSKFLKCLNRMYAGTCCIDSEQYWPKTSTE